MKRLKKVCFYMLGIIISMICINVGYGNTEAVQAATGVSISQTIGFLLPGETLQLSISGSSKTVTWSSEYKEIASVTKNGKVTAKECGSTYVSAKVDNKTYKCLIYVVDISSIYVYREPDTLTTNGGPIRIHAASMDYDEVIEDLDMDYQIVGNHKGKITPITKSDAFVYSNEDGEFEVEASFHGKQIGTCKFWSIQFSGFSTNQISLTAGGTGAVYTDLKYYYPRLEDITVTSSDSSVAVAKAVQFSDFVNNDYLGYFCVKALKAGTAVISVKIADNTHTFQVNVTGEQQPPLYDPVQAVKLGKFNGYSGNELKSLLYVYDFIHDYGLDSTAMSDKDKMDYIQILFYYFYDVRNYYIYNWTCYGDVSRVLQLQKGLDSSTACAETVSFLLDCMGIPNYYCTGTYNGTSWAWNQVEVDGTWVYLDAAGYLIEKRPSIMSNDLWKGYKLDKKAKYSDQAEAGKDYFSIIG